MRERPARILESLIARWRGVALTLIIGVTTLWLAATGQLVLYIHPRYVVFTVVLTVVGMALALLALAMGGENADGHDDHDVVMADSDIKADSNAGASISSARGSGSRLVGTVGLVVTAAVALSLVAPPPATLSSATASTRGLGQGATSVSPNAAPSGPTSDYTVLDWANRLRQSTDIGAYENEPVDVTGFVTASPGDPDTFFVTRFVVTCCAVDAQPVGVPVYDPEWKSTLAKDQWVRIRGAFAINPSTAGSAPITLVPNSVRKVTQPHDPYLS